MLAKRLKEIEARKREMLREIEGASEARMAELESELNALNTEETEIRRKMDFSARAGSMVEVPSGRSDSSHEERAAEFARTNREVLNTRAMLLSGGTIATPAGVGENINDAYGVEVSTLVDMVTVEDCTGMGAFSEAYIESGMTAGDGKEGETPAEDEVKTGVVKFTPSEFSVVSYVSRQIRKQTPLNYETKVVTSARTALRKKTSKKIIDEIYNSDIVQRLELTDNKINEKTLRSIVLAYGGDESVGSGALILSKADLTAFGDVRGTSEKKAVYEITPDTGNPNTGIIKDGGMSVRYVLNSNCNTLTGATASATTMIYGDPRCCKLALWGDLEVSTSEDYKFAEGLLSVRGETMADAKVNVYHGFIVVSYVKA